MTRVLTTPSLLPLSGNQQLAPKRTTPSAMREYRDAPATRKLIFSQALDAAKSLPPYSNARHTLTLDDTDYADDPTYSLAAYKQAVLEGRTLSRRLRGTWQLKDNATGAVLDKKRQTVAHVPYLMNDGTFVHRGNTYSLSNQMRLRPGIFTRVKDSGELEAHVNIRPGEGKSHRYFLDPEKGVFYARIGQAKIPLIPLLRTLGADDRQLRDAWGPELLAANMQNDSPAAMGKYYQRLLRTSDLELDDLGKKKRLIEEFQKMRLDPLVTEKTLGKGYENLGLEAILATTKKLLAISRNEADVDDRDHLAFQTFHGPEDLIAERLAKDYGGIRRRLFNRASWRGNLSAVPTNALNKQVEAVLLRSGLAQVIDQINPADALDKQSLTSRMGEGGIPSIDSIPDEARSVQPSHFGFYDPVQTPESMRVGVDLHLARAVRKGADGKLYAPFIDTSTGKTVYRSPQDVADEAIAFPGQTEQNTKRVWATAGGQIKLVSKKDVRLALPHFENAFSPLSNMIPFKSAIKGQRVTMAARYLTQAVPLVNAEAPLVQSGVPDQEGESYESLYAAHMGAVRASESGRVMSVEPGSITIRYLDGKEKTIELYQNHPFAQKTFIHQRPLVQPGQAIHKGDVLAASNYTNDKGVTALGKNVRVAYIPFGGKNFEDAVVVSQSMAERFTSQHMYKHRLDKDAEHKLGRGAFLSLFPAKFDRRQVESLDDRGIVKPGTEVNYGDPLILAARGSEPGKHKVHRRGSRSFSDTSEIWKHHSPGVVTDAVDTPKGTTVLVKSMTQLQIGDKLTGRMGDKGVVASIEPDNRMPRDRDGKPFELLLNPTGMHTRVNPSQILEAALGKIAAKTGKPYRVPDFENIEDLTEFVIRELETHDVRDTEDLIDPETGRKIPGIFTGNRFILKLHHMAEGKGQGRSVGGYTSEDQPAKSGDAGAKRLGLMDTNALLSHGATQVLRDARVTRGQRNEDFWLAYMQGHTPPVPKVPLVYEKFVNELKASGINVIADGPQTHIMALTDKDVKLLAGDREIKHGETVRFDKGLEPVPGGLFDPKLTGGHQGNRWSFIKLNEPMPNPVMEEPIRRLLGLTQKKFEAILSGRDVIPVGDYSMTGSEGIVKALEAMNLDRELLMARAAIKGTKKTDRDAAIRKLGYLKSAKQFDIHPKDWILHSVPVLPPKFRPISVMSHNKTPLVSDANYLYKELLAANENLATMKKEVDDVGEERLALYHSFQAVTGLGDPLHPKLREKRVSGMLKHIFGKSPKYGTIQRRLLSSTVDLVGRAVITPDPDLDMDHIGIPEDKAWDVYKPFIVRRLRRRGLPLREAASRVRDRTKDAKEELLQELKSRPVFIARAPVLHRFGIMAFWPKLVKDTTAHVSPLIVKGFNADFDGDTISYHVPVSDDARQEAIDLMLPSRNLLSPADFKTPVHVPGQEYVGGLFSATSPPAKKRRPHQFMSVKDAIQAYMRGDISIDTPVEID